MSEIVNTANVDAATVDGFGDEWARLPQSDMSEAERRRLFDAYFHVFPWSRVDRDSEGADFGCGSGRWALLVAPRVGRLRVVDASAAALDVARANLDGLGNVAFHHASIENIAIPDASLDFAYSLGVLHHMPDTAAAFAAIARKLKPGAPFLVYLYYAFDNRPAWYRWIWRGSELVRAFVSRLPHGLRFAVSQLIAALVYWPLARAARLLEKAGALPSAWPLAAYRDISFHGMRTDALDRFGTRLEQRFTKNEIEAMFAAAGFDGVRFSDELPFWCAVGFKKPIIVRGDHAE